MKSEVQLSLSAMHQDDEGEQEVTREGVLIMKRLVDSNLKRAKVYPAV